MQLRAAGHVLKPLRTEIRDNLLTMLREGEDPWPGLPGSRAPSSPAERALIAGHDVVLLGERGQGKARLLRTMVGLLDEWTPVISGSRARRAPLEPITHGSKAAVAAHGDDLRISWKHRAERYSGEAATPDTSVADLIGDVDPMKVAEGRSLGDPETIHFGLIPRSHRGIVAIDELPDLAERIQVAMLNVMEERDIQIRGYVVRLPLDVLVVASANPEDYTNRGRIITPLKDRFGAEIRTHYPQALHRDRRGPPRSRPRCRRTRLPGGDPGPVHPQPAGVVVGRPAVRRLRALRDRRGGDRRSGGDPSSHRPG